MSDKSEKLLKAWLSLSGILRNERIVQGFTFREITICNFIFNCPAGSFVTPSDITELTGMLKSQTNKVLSDLEAKEYIKRIKDPDDKRRIILKLTDKGKKMYLKEHKEVIRLLDSVTETMSESRINAMCEDIDHIAEELYKFKQENLI